MKDLLALLFHLLVTIAKLLGPGGTRAVVADNLLMKQQLLVINRARRRADSCTLSSLRPAPVLIVPEYLTQSHKEIAFGHNSGPVK